MHRWVETARAKGGFFTGVQQNEDFVPWHRINFVERVDKQDKTRET